MKRVLFLIVTLIVSSVAFAQEWQGNRYIDSPTTRESKYVENPYFYTDKKGVECAKVFINKENGHCKVYVIKDGEKKARYLSPKVSEEYARKMSIPYIPPKPRKP